jgi:putative SOS response-associated peptidase YedK
MLGAVCGRYVASSPPGVLAEYFEVDDVRAEAERPSWNVAPTDPVPAVAVRHERRLLGLFRWGLIPSWSTDGSGAAGRINARAETVREKPTFRAAFARRRCLLPADGFYEWERRPDGSKQAWFIRRADGAPLAMAGLWDAWRGDGGELVRSCAVVTTTANSLMAPIHDRMPVLIPSSDWATWLDPSNEGTAELTHLLVPAEARLLERYAVTARVNTVRNNGPELIEPDGSLETG